MLRLVMRRRRMMKNTHHGCSSLMFRLQLLIMIMVIKNTVHGCSESIFRLVKTMMIKVMMKSTIWL